MELHSTSCQKKMCVGDSSRLGLPYDFADDGGFAARGVDDGIDVDISGPSPFACIAVGALRHSSSYSAPGLGFDYTSRMDCVNLPERQASVREKGCHWGKHLAHRSRESHSELNAVDDGSAGYIVGDKSVQSLVAGIGIQGLPSDVTGRTPVNTSWLVV